MTKTTFLFVRHAESQKNLMDITGGKGAELTEKGMAQAHKLCEEILMLLNGTTCSVISSDKIQAVLTGEIIATKLGLQLIVTKNLMPADMGIINGLSNKEIQDKYPNIYKQLKSWRNQEIEACELTIEGMESPFLFWNRMENYLHSICDGGFKIIVCTRSILVFIYNYIHRKMPSPGGGYKHIFFNNCDTLLFSIDSYGKVSIENE